MRCLECNEDYPLSHYERKGGWSGRYYVSICRKCTSAKLSGKRKAQKTYYEEMLEKQGLELVQTNWGLTTVKIKK
jgi:hypothetical protein